MTNWNREHLHNKKLIHRDLKSHNLLVNDTWNCKVADFGISTIRPTITRVMTCVGTPVYMAPEVLSKSKYSEKADVFSFGIVLMEIFTGNLPYSNPPYHMMNQAQLMYQILEQNVRPSLAGVPLSIQRLAEECWSHDVRLRPSFSEIVVRLGRLEAEFSPSNDPEMGQNWHSDGDESAGGIDLSNLTASSYDGEEDSLLSFHSIQM